MWQCIYCHFNNNEDSSSCRACFAKRKIQKLNNEECKSGYDYSKTKGLNLFKKWECPDCNFHNKPYTNTCKACFNQIITPPISREKLDEYLVSGYIHEQIEDELFEYEIPSDIIRLCHTWYHQRSHLILSSSQQLTCTDTDAVDDDYNILSMNEEATESCYGTIIMPSISLINIEYKYRIKVRYHNTSIFDKINIQIGITEENDADKFKNALIQNDDPRNKCLCGAYMSDGTEYKVYVNEVLYSHGNHDIITVVYRPSEHRLWFFRNGLLRRNDCYKCGHKTPFILGRKDIKYRLCVYLPKEVSCSVQLISNVLPIHLDEI